MWASQTIYSNEPPPIQTRVDNNPTVLVTWWASFFALTIILIRLAGRYVRTERLFLEDKIIMLAVVPLFIRTILVNFVLDLGTNNTYTQGLSHEDIQNRELGSKLVLVTRIFYPLSIWIMNLSIAVSLQRVAEMMWKRSFTMLHGVIYWFLVSTFLAVVISTLAQCRPFDHYWQVVPDPGPQCRSGYANLITMGVCNVITDVILIALPVSVVLTVSMGPGRRISLVAIYLLPLTLIAFTCCRVIFVIQHNGSQQYRSLLASLDILATAGIANFVVISSFLQDKGVKKSKYRQEQRPIPVIPGYHNDSANQPTLGRRRWGSDWDLVAELGLGPSTGGQSSAIELQMTGARQ